MQNRYFFLPVPGHQEEVTTVRCVPHLAAVVAGARGDRVQQMGGAHLVIDEEVAMQVRGGHESVSG